MVAIWNNSDTQNDPQLYSTSECKKIMDLHKMAWIELNLGQQVKSLPKQVFIGILYSVILCTGVFGNIATCTVIARKRYMHTRTNCYLFSLAVSDLLLLVCGLPLELVDAVHQVYPWRFGTALCKLRVFLTELSPIVSIIILTVFSVERYLSVCHPFRRKFRFDQNECGTVMSRCDKPLCHPSYSSAKDVSCHGYFGGGLARFNSACCQTPRRAWHTYLHRGTRVHSLKSCYVLIFITWSFAALCATPISGLTEAFVSVKLPEWFTYVNASQKPLCRSEQEAAQRNKYAVQTRLEELGDEEECIIPMTEKCENFTLYWINEMPLYESTVCAPSPNAPWASVLSHRVVLQLSTIIFFLVPMGIMIVLYSRIAVTLRRSNLTALLAQRSDDSKRDCNYTVQEQAAINMRKGITRMLVAIVVSFFICWAPFHLQRILASAGLKMGWFYVDFIFYLSGCLYYVSSTVNPILYSLMSARFRRAFKATFCIRKPRTSRLAKVPQNVRLQITYAPKFGSPCAGSSQGHSDHMVRDPVADQMTTLRFDP
ncbi:Neuropeptides capa receptor [Fasciola hepatica]|uniref:Neuropeptides capa receptor n=1 Tax=Fasciola hepatica TaxID=6192 RepID=A0A4E0RI68_FASHE|nr:Neuropeptides capa receptor [Fasciola hepatica]